MYPMTSKMSSKGRRRAVSEASCSGSELGSEEEQAMGWRLAGCRAADDCFSIVGRASWRDKQKRAIWIVQGARSRFNLSLRLITRLQLRHSHQQLTAPTWLQK